MINKRKIILTVGLLIVLMAGVFGALTLVRNSQDLRNKAATSGATTIKLSQDTISGAVGSTVVVGVLIDTPRKVSTAKVVLCYGDALTTDESSINASVGPLTVENYKKIENNCVTISKRVESSETAPLGTGSFQFANITFTIKASGDLTISKTDSLIAGEPLNGDVNIPIDEVVGAKITASGSGNGSTMKFESSDLVSKKVGENLSVKLYLDTTKNFDAAQVKFCYGDKIKLEDSGIVKGSDFTDIAKKTISNNCLEYTVLASGKILTGKKLLGTFTFKALTAGNGTITFDSSLKQFSNATDGLMKVENSPSASYKILTGDSNSTPITIKLSFTGVTKGNDQCVFNWFPKMKIRDKSGNDILTPGVNYVSSGLVKTDDVNSRGEIIYTFTTNLVEFTKGVTTEKLAFFLTGPKHISLKYGKDKQNSWYSTLIGDLSVVGGADNTYDFSEFPLLAGDVTGDTVGNSDGKIDARDWSFVKQKSQPITVGSQGADLVGDVDGNCQVNAIDAALVKRALIEINGQTY